MGYILTVLYVSFLYIAGYASIHFSDHSKAAFWFATQYNAKKYLALHAAREARLKNMCIAYCFTCVVVYLAYTINQINQRPLKADYHELLYLCAENNSPLEHMAEPTVVNKPQQSDMAECVESVIAKPNKQIKVELDYDKALTSVYSEKGNTENKNKIFF